jgi:hypothetical protein
MNINDIAEEDLSFIIEDKENGTGVDLLLYDEDSNEYPVVAIVNDIGYFIDPATGVGVVGRTVEATVRISSLSALSNDDPPSVDWMAKYTDKSGETWNMGVASPPRVDRTLGIYLITFESVTQDDSET